MIDRRFWIGAALLIVFALLARDFLASRGPGAGDPAPAFAATTLDGEAVSLAGLKGQVVLLNFFATW